MGPANMTAPAAPAEAAPRPGTAWLDIRVGEVRQLFNAMDPAPFRERDIDPNAENYILEWGRETRAGQPLGLVVHLARDPATPETAGMLRDAFHEYFRRCSDGARRRLRHLLRIGRLSLVIGIAFVTVAILLGEFVGGLVSKGSYGSIVRESLVIGAWVALWRPLEIFLYDWWPIRAEARLHDRLSEMDVRLVGADGTRIAGTP
jgi:hypothetical protein